MDVQGKKENPKVAIWDEFLGSSLIFALSEDFLSPECDSINWKEVLGRIVKDS